MSVTDDVLREIYNRYQPPLSNPSVTASFVGTSGTTVYYYVVTAIGDTGETDGTVVQVQGFEVLNADNYVSLRWVPVKNAKKYRIYGRSQNLLGLLVETTETSWNDYGVVVPDTTKTPPVTNTTGRTDWESLEFLPGRSLQSAELNEIQAILADAQEKLARTLFNDGDIISGCGIAVFKDYKKVYITSGRIYVRGRVRRVDGAVLDITAIGDEIIGVKVIEEYIDANDDPILLDPAQGYPGYQTQGALRKKIKLQWVVNDNDAIPVYYLKDGNLLKAFQGTRYSELEKRLAVRTNDISGDCIVEGLKVEIVPHSQRRDSVILRLGSGKAYVQGYEVWKPLVSEYSVQTAVESAIVNAEVVSPRTSGSYIYEVDAVPVKKVNYVTGSFFSSETRIVPSAVDENNWYIDSLPYASVDEVVGLWESSVKTVQYVLNTDYKVIGNTIRLNPSKFSPGQTYYIEYYYFQELEKGKRSLVQQVDSFITDGETTQFITTKTDVVNEKKYFPLKVWLEDDNGSKIKDYIEGKDYVVDLGRTETSIGHARVVFSTPPEQGKVLKVQYYYWNHDVEGDYVSIDSYLNSSDPFGDYLYETVIDKNVVDLRTTGRKPNKINLIVGYEYFLPQRAFILLDKDGNIELLRGVASLRPRLPSKPQGKLVLYELYFPAFASAEKIVSILQDRYRVMKIYDMNVLRERVERMHYDLAMTELGLDIGGSTVPARKGSFVDSFNNALRMDVVESRVSLNTIDGKCLLPMTVKTYVPSFNSSASTARVSGNFVTKTYSREVGWIWQPVWTEGFMLSVNPYGVFGEFGTVELYPSRDIWYERKEIDDWLNDVRLTYTAQWDENVSTETLRNWVARTLGVDVWRLSVGSGSGDSFSFEWQGDSILVSTEIVNELRQITVYFRLFSLPDTEFQCYVGGIRVSLSLPTQAELDSLGLGWNVFGDIGNASGNLKTGVNGWLTGKFTIPSGVRGEEVSVVFESVDGFVRCGARYSGYGTVETFRRQRQNIRVDITRLAPPPPPVYDWWWEPEPEPDPPPPPPPPPEPIPPEPDPPPPPPPPEPIPPEPDQSTTRRRRRRQPSPPPEIEIVQDETVVLGWEWGTTGDPLAQTFIPPRDGFIESIDLWFYSIPEEEEIVSVTIRETQLGFPTNIVLGRSNKTRTEIANEAGISLSARILDGEPSENNGRVRFVFDSPVYVQGGKEYVFTIDNSAPGFSVYCARVGRKVLGDLSGQREVGSILDRQAYEGVVLASSNARTWESYQNVDLMFRINRAKFDLTPQYYVFNPIDLSDLNGGGEMVVLSSEVIPPGTEILWEWREEGSSSGWKLFRPVRSLNDVHFVEMGDNKEKFGKLVNNLTLRASLFTYSDFVSPVIVRDVVRAIVGRYEENGVYVSNNVSLVGGITYENIKIWFWWVGNGGSVNKVEISVDGGNVWYEVPQINFYPVPNRIGVMEYEYGGSLNDITNEAVTSAGQFKVRIRFSSPHKYDSPEISRLRVVVW